MDACPCHRGCDGYAYAGCYRDRRGNSYYSYRSHQ